MECMSKNPSLADIHRVGRFLKAQQKRFTQMNKKTQVSELVLMCIKSIKLT